MKANLLLIVWFVLAGCTVRPVPLQIEGIERSAAVRVHDLRPAEEKQAKTFSRLVTSSAYGIYRVAEDAGGPSPIRLLQHRAFEKLGEPLELTVHHLVVYLNWQAEGQSQALAVGIASVGGVGVSHTPPAPGTGHSLADRAVFDSLAAKEHQRAWYSREENPKSGSVYVIYVDTEINGKRVFTRTLAPLERKKNALAPANALEAAFAFHLTQY
ncbi:MAG TPA: hypothetical protein VF618_18620 [Thermoanaerobaculia bacterium]